MFSWLGSVYCPGWSLRISKPWPVLFLSCSRNRNRRESRREGLKETWGWSLPLQLQDACLCPSCSSVPNEGDAVATSCKATFESQVLSPASLVFQTRGTLLSCLLFFYLWNLLQKNLQWYDTVDSNYSISQGFFFLYFYSSNGETLWIFMYR